MVDDVFCRWLPAWQSPLLLLYTPCWDSFPSTYDCKWAENSWKLSGCGCDSLIDVREADGLLLEVVADADEVKVAGDEDQCLLHVPLFVQGQHLKIMSQN